jgi:hypothetical protein
MTNDQDEPREVLTPPEQPVERSSLGAALAQAAAAGAATGVANQVAGKLLNRPPKEEPPKVELPPGVNRD